MDYFKYYKQLLNKSDFEKLQKSLEKPFRKSIRINTLKISVAEFKKIAKKKKWILTQVPWCKEGFFIDRVDRSVPLGKDLLHHSGCFYIQEASSMYPISLLSDVKDTDLILDLCAAPGSKFTQVSQKGEKLPMIVANEPSGNRIKGLVSNIKRLGIKNSVVVKHDPSTLAKIFPNTFDKILLDAPCSGDGMIRRDNKTLDRWTYSRIKFQAGVQKRLIKEAFKLLKVGGELIYSTCTLTKEEDEEVLEYLLSEYDSAEMSSFKTSKKGFLRIWPFDYDTEGFFVSKITKTEGTEREFIKPKKSKNEKRGFDYLANKKTKFIQEFFNKTFGFDFNLKEDDVLIEKNGETWLWSKPMLRITKKVNPVFSGICVGKLYTDSFSPDHSFINVFGDKFIKNIIEIDLHSATDYLYGKDLKIDKPSGYYLIKSEGLVLGLGKSIQGKIKNVMPRSLVLS